MAQQTQGQCVPEIVLERFNASEHGSVIWYNVG